MLQVFAFFLLITLFYLPVFAGKHDHKTQEIVNVPPSLPSNSLVPLNFPVIYSSGNNFSQEAALAGIRRLPMRGLPDLPHNMLYIVEQSGSFHIYGYSLDSRYRVCVFGPNEQGYVDFVTEHGDVEESFCYAFHHSIRYDYNPPITYPKLKEEDETHSYHQYNKCHKIGREFTKPQSNNSNFAVNNFYPGCWALNQAENALIATGLGAYGKILLYENTPHVLTQKIKHTPRNTGRNPVKVFFGLIFKSFYQNGSVKIHYFPHDKGSGETHTCFYHDLKERHNHYTNILRFFEIQNTSHLFEPLMWDLRASPQERYWTLYKAFYQGLNLRFQFSLHDILAFLKDLDLPFSWNGCRGYTQEDIQRRVSLLHRRRPPGPRLQTHQTQENRALNALVWHNFQFPTLRNDALIWEDARDDEIPLTPNNDYFTSSHRGTFLAYLSLRLLEDAAKYETGSISMKLGVSRIYWGEGKYQKAMNWIQAAYRQCFETHSLPDSLKLFRFYMKYRYNLLATATDSATVNQDLVILSRLIQETKQGSSVEELLDLEEFNQEMEGKLPSISSGIEGIKKLSSENSKLLNTKILTAAAVDKLVQIIQRTHSLEELSLERTIFHVEPEECIRTSSMPLDEWNDEKQVWEHISDDGDWDEEFISEEEYFWNEEKPLSKILSVLQKHSHSLKKLSFSYIRFNKHSESIRILDTLKETRFPHLEELVLVGNFMSGGEQERLALNSLQPLFSKCRIFY